MNSSFKLAAVTLGLLTSPTCWGCLAPTRPLADSEYKSIVLAEVVGVHLTEYAALRLEQARGRLLDYRTDSSHTYEVQAVVFETLQGPAAEKVSIRVPSGCAVPTPELNQFGIFYIDEGGDAQVVLQHDPEYLERLQKLNSRHTATCRDDIERLTPHPCWKATLASLHCMRDVERAAKSTQASCSNEIQLLYEALKEQALHGYK